MIACRPQILNRKIPRLLTEYKQSLLSILEETFLRDYNMHDLKALCVDQARIDRAAQTWNNQVGVLNKRSWPLELRQCLD